MNFGAGVATGKKRNKLKVALDVGVVNPQAACHISDAAEAVLGSATAYTQKKRDDNDTDALCDAVGIDYQPIVWESFGGLSEEGQKTLKSINRLVAVNTNTPTSEVAQRFWQKMSVDMQKANHRAFVKRVSRQYKTTFCDSFSNKFLQAFPEDTGNS